MCLVWDCVCIFQLKRVSQVSSQCPVITQYTCCLVLLLQPSCCCHRYFLSVSADPACHSEYRHFSPPSVMGAEISLCQSFKRPKVKILAPILSFSFEGEARSWGCTLKGIVLYCGGAGAVGGKCNTLFFFFYVTPSIMLTWGAANSEVVFRVQMHFLTRYCYIYMFIQKLGPVVFFMPFC